MAAVDQAKFLTNRIVNKLNDLRDVLAIIGLFYTAKKSISVLSSVLHGIRTYLMPLIHQIDLKHYGKWAVVTGCTEGIGKAYCQILAKRGLNIVLISRNYDKLKALAHQLESVHHIKTCIITVDFSYGNSIYKQIREDLADKEIGVLVNNVGIMAERPMLFEEVSSESLWNQVMINVGAVTMMTNIILPQMTKRKKGVIINVSSSAAIYPLPLMAVYSATKVYVDYLTRALQEEYRGSGIIIQCIMPFYVATAMTKFSKTLQDSKWFVPDAPTYVRHSLATVGHSHRTTGYWSHGLQYLILGTVPEWVWLRCGTLINKFLRNDVNVKRNRFMAELLPQD